MLAMGMAINLCNQILNYFQGSTTGNVYDVNDLEAGHEYGFAVKASNAVGDSDALPTAKLIMAKDQFCKYGNRFFKKCLLYQMALNLSQLNSCTYLSCFNNYF